MEPADLPFPVSRSPQATTAKPGVPPSPRYRPGVSPSSARPSPPREPQAPGRSPWPSEPPTRHGRLLGARPSPPDLPRAGAAPGAAIATSPGHAGSAARAPPLVRPQTLPARDPAGKCDGNISSGGKRPASHSHPRTGDPEGPSVASGDAGNVLDVLPDFVLGWRTGFMGIDFTFFPVAGFGFGMGDLGP